MVVGDDGVIEAFLPVNLYRVFSGYQGFCAVHVLVVASNENEAEEIAFAAFEGKVTERRERGSDMVELLGPIPVGSGAVGKPWGGE